MKTPIRITVIIAAYHGEKYIGELLNSLFTQTRVPDEILIGDDSDDDATFLAIEAVKTRYDGELRCFRNPEKLGICANFEHLYREAKGGLVFFCDQDDVWLPEKIEKMSSYMTGHPECDLLFCDSYCTDGALRKLGCTMFSRYAMTASDVDTINSGHAFPLVVMKNIPFSSHDIALRKVLDYNVFPFDSGLGLYQDQHLGYLTSYMERMRCLPEPLTLYRRHDANASQLFSFDIAFDHYSVRDGDTHAAKLREFTDKMRRMLEILHKTPLCCEENRFNAGYLAEMIRFFDKRRELLKLPEPLRFFRLSPRDHFDYFRYCRGWRTLAHDLLCARPGRSAGGES